MEWSTSSLVIAAVLVVPTWWFLFAQLLKWKHWAEEYKAWVKANCQCNAPGNGAPIQPSWP